MRILIASIIKGDPTAPGANYSNAMERLRGSAFFCGAMDSAASRRAASDFDGLLLAGGGDTDAAFFGEDNHPRAEPVPKERDMTELRLAESFMAAKKPILAICRGMQLLNVALGGTLIQHIGDLEGCIEHSGKDLRHQIYLEKGGLLREIFPGQKTLIVNSTHHQALGRLGEELSIEAVGPDGIVEAVKARSNILGVQFHPERMLDEGMMPLMSWFADCCRGDTEQTGLRRRFNNVDGHE
ncbi:MAG: gamma-glutamyl-gamma-aminobutyrate hydrolase family protein [Christensenellales bacterium]|jgi:putative glutamine amidotransferase